MPYLRLGGGPISENPPSFQRIRFWIVGGLALLEGSGGESTRGPEVSLLRGDMALRLDAGEAETRLNRAMARAQRARWPGVAEDLLHALGRRPPGRNRRADALRLLADVLRRRE